MDTPSTVEEFRTGTGASNAPVIVGPLIISEIMYHPTIRAGSVVTDNTFDEYGGNSKTFPQPTFLCTTLLP